MPMLVILAGGISIIAFGWHGASLIWTQAMVADFARYGLSPYRSVIGTLHLAGSAGLLLGFWFRPLLPLAAGSLALMMLVAIGYRLHDRDPLLAILPAIVLCVLNVVLVAQTR
ncbi:MAG: DoxX family protein [Gemmatimonadales bacterium]|nr:DoxX family protein [Gemmatimonadales bacterium]